jgi:hypothetical protein
LDVVEHRMFPLRPGLDDPEIDVEMVLSGPRFSTRIVVGSGFDERIEVSEIVAPTTAGTGAWGLAKFSDRMVCQ